MNDNSVDSLILELTESLEAKPLYNPMKLIFPLLIGIIGYVLLSLYLITIRNDVSNVLGSPAFMFEIILAVLLSLSSLLASSWLKIPDQAGNRFYEYSTWTLFSVFIVWIFVHSVLGGIGTIDFHYYKCITDGLIVVSVPMILMVFLSRKGHTTHPFRMAFFNYLCVASLCWAALRFTCGNDILGHLMMYHFLPYTIIGIILGLLARRVYSW
jgi:hypothetical protein